jgi:hypothetical protein
LILNNIIHSSQLLIDPGCINDVGKVSSVWVRKKREVDSNSKQIPSIKSLSCSAMFVVQLTETKMKLLWMGTLFPYRIGVFLTVGHNYTSVPALRLGGAEVQDSDELLQQAVNVAKDADAVLAIVGSNANWEVEGYNHTTLALPGRTDELISTRSWW